MSASTNNDKVYFPGLDGIRFLAALSVVFYHIEQIKSWFGINSSSFSFADLLLDGEDAVTLFFVLSGFLITYLLLVENQRQGEISIRHFYVRRILRIWPLYYLMVFLGFVALPSIEGALGVPGYFPLANDPPLKALTKLVEYMLLVPHIGAFFGSYVTGIGQLWSIGIEEQFYLIWPVLFRKFVGWLPALLVAVIGLKLGLIFFALLIAPSQLLPEWYKVIVNLVVFIRMENMAVGGVGAFLLFTGHKRFLSFIFHPVVQSLTLLLLVGNIFFFTGTMHPLVNQALSILYVVFILNVSSNPRSMVKLEHPALNALGRISYGIYMYHVLVIYLLLTILTRLGITLSEGLAGDLILYPLATVLTIGIAHVSYNKFEAPFLRLKQRFVVVASGQPDRVIERAREPVFNDLSATASPSVSSQNP